MISKELLGLTMGLVLTGGLLVYNTSGNNNNSTRSEANIPVVSDFVVSNSSSLPTPAPAEPLKLSNKVIKKLNLPLNRTVTLIGQVGANALDVADRITALQNESDAPIYLIITGPGGSVLTGANVIAAIQASRAPVYTICSVICASMSAMIHQYGKERYVVDRTILMFHPASSGTDGDVDRMVSYSTSIQRYVNKMELDVANRSKIDYDEYKKLVAVELWIDSEDSVAKGLADRIVSYNVNSINQIMFVNNKGPTRSDIGLPSDFLWIAPWVKKDGK